MKSIKKLYPLLLFVLLITGVAGCAPYIEATDQFFTAPDFSIAIEVNASQETHATMIVTNNGDTLFPADEDFGGQMTLWKENGEPRAKIEAHTIQKIKPKESVFLASSSWKLNPGNYFITWGAPEYGGVIGIFTIAEDNHGLYLDTAHMFHTKPAKYNETIQRVGVTKSFRLEDDGTLILRGESALPEGACIFPLLVGPSGFVEGYPAGQCAQVANGQWQIEIPSEPSTTGLTLEGEEPYKVILFSNDLTISPSVPFTIEISPPAGDG